MTATPLKSANMLDKMGTEPTQNIIEYRHLFNLLKLIRPGIPPVILASMFKLENTVTLMDRY